MRPLPPPRRAVRRRFGRDPVADDGILIWFPGPRSFTGEDVAELHIHGGRAVYLAVAGLLTQAGARMADPGEFTRRAFENGKLDLTQAEGIADLVAAETEGQRRSALRQMDGELGRLYEGWRLRLIDLIAQAEAAIDFPDEDLPAGLLDHVVADAGGLQAELSGHLDDGRRGERLRDGFHVAILGAPNAGKSSLLNALVGRAAAIVHPAAGTTRDVIEVAVDLAGWPVVFSDTAGLRAALDPVEAEGVRRARERAGLADLKLLVVDGAAGAPADELLGLADEKALLVLNKIDLGECTEAHDLGPAIRVSASTGHGLTALADAIAAKAAEAMDGASLTPTRLRHREAVESCIRHLASMDPGTPPELMVEDLRLAARALGRAVGRIDVEDVLDAVFRQFCIGK
ncbi:tRNA modification GTPase MnmE [Allostella vacuolata]|nr:tRNA modification GTPase MnmE [Stella vacuolata]